MQLFGAEPETWGYFKVIGFEGTPLDRIDGVMIIGMFAGCFAAALWANNIKLRMPQHRIRIFKLFWAVLSLDLVLVWQWCNLAAFFTGIPQFSLRGTLLLLLQQGHILVRNLH